MDCATSILKLTLYGPGYHTDGRQLHFIYDLIRKILRSKLYGEPVVLWGDGDQQRELIYVEDFVDILLRLATVYDNDIFNIGAGIGHTIRDFAQVVCDVVGYEANRIQYDTTAYVGAKSKVLSMDKASGVLPARHKRSLPVGIQRTAEWMLSQRDYSWPGPSAHEQQTAGCLVGDACQSPVSGTPVYLQ